MKRALLALGLSAATITAACGKDPDPIYYDEAGRPIPPPGQEASVPNLGDGGSLPDSEIINVEIPRDVDHVPYEKDVNEGLDQGTLDQLKAAGGAPCGVKVVYPYDGTAFPAGLISPPVMFDGPVDAVLAHYEYQGNDAKVNVNYATKPTGTEFRLPQNHWNEIVGRAKPQPLAVTLTVRRNGQISTCKQTWTIARGVMQGAIFYNTYQHQDLGGNGGVLRLTLGRNTPEVYLRATLGAAVGVGPCVACHSVSAGGNTIAASQHAYGTPNEFASFSTPVTPALNPTNRVKTPQSTFGALTPDGKYMLRMGNPQCTTDADTFPRAPNNFPLVEGTQNAALIETATGKEVAATGLSAMNYMWMPQFSPDGKRVVFNHAKPAGTGTDRRELAIMDFDQGTLAFTNLRVISSPQLRAAAWGGQMEPNPTLPYAPKETTPFVFGGLNFGGRAPGVNGCAKVLTDGNFDGSGRTSRGDLPTGTCSGPCYPAWPFFTPDGRGVVYSLISEPDFTVAFPGRDKASISELWYTNIDNPAQPLNMRLDKLNKALEGEDTRINYYPTVLPVQVGGYFWVFWTSTRKWGTREYKPEGFQLPNFLIAGASPMEALKKRIWVSAIKASSNATENGYTVTSDPSFPGFYLEGQSASGNTRAFAALNPCKTEGGECSTSLDCCDGRCIVPDGATKGTCMKKTDCSKVNEACAGNAECCKPGLDEPPLFCIANRCGFSAQ